MSWTPLDVTMELRDGDWADAEGSQEATLERVAVLPRGTKEGRPAIAMLLRLPSDETIIAFTTYNLFLTAALAFKARWGDPS